MITKALLIAISVLVLTAGGLGLQLKAAIAEAELEKNKAQTSADDLATQKETSAELAADLEVEQLRRRQSDARAKAEAAKRIDATKVARKDHAEIRTEITSAISLSECATVRVPAAAVSGLQHAADRANGIH